MPSLEQGRTALPKALAAAAAELGGIGESGGEPAVVV